jgi:hypothetical protein
LRIVPRVSASGCGTFSGEIANPSKKLCNLSAYGRAIIARSSALRSLAAAIIFIALVIFCVFLTATILVRIFFGFSAMAVHTPRRSVAIRRPRFMP